MTKLDNVILFAHFPQATLTRYKKVLVVVNNFDLFFQNPDKYLDNIKWSNKTKELFLIWFKNLNKKNIFDILNNHDITCIPITHQDYPELLKQITDPPLALFVRGKINRHENTQAIVGTRNCSFYGKRITEQVTKTLKHNDATLVSGMALGIDAIAHKAALKYDIRTIAVVAGGVDEPSLSPKTNITLSREILDNNGAIISEYPPGIKPEIYTFPKRNRIIAGLCKQTIVTEAPIRSGALITAYLAIDYNREVLAIPHSLENPSGRGNNKLISQGAICIYDISKLIKQNKITNNIIKKINVQLTKSEQDIYNIISQNEISIKNIASQSCLSQSQLLSILMSLEMKDVIINIGGMRYKKT